MLSLKPIVTLAVFVLFFSCDRKPFVEHDIIISKKSEGCDQVSAQFKMISNFGGERYEFTKCLPSGFDANQVTVARQGDSVVIKFPPVTGSSVAAFEIIIDIDSYPRYNYLTIDDETYSLAHSDK